MKHIPCLFFAFSFSAWAAPCVGEAVGYWTNPDGSRGGWVGKDAKVEAGAYIAPTAEVCESARVHGGAKILDYAIVNGRALIASGSVISGRARVGGESKVGGSGAITKIGGDVQVEGSAIITGSTHIYARAKIGGGAKVHNSIICQASLIQSISVIDSVYYCQSEDPEPPHPGELGKKTLLGLDIDKDGLRDDLEIWINDKFSNTASKDDKEIRNEFKYMAKTSTETIRFSNDSAKVISLAVDGTQSIECLASLVSFAEIAKINNEYEANLMNTKERFNAYMSAQKFLAGTVGNTKLKGKAACVKK